VKPPYGTLRLGESRLFNKIPEETANSCGMHWLIETVGWNSLIPLEYPRSFLNAAHLQIHLKTGKTRSLEIFTRLN
jgi:hypothetical protein